MAAEVGLACEVHSTEKLHELKMGAFWAWRRVRPSRRR
jgi:leucyl aminopeptidase